MKKIKKNPKGMKWVKVGDSWVLEDRRTDQERLSEHLKAEGAARRAADIANGVNRSRGAGAHGGSVRQKTRRDRKDVRQKLRRGDFD